MKSIGFDIGTSSICGIVIDERHEICDIVTEKNWYVPSEREYEMIQDADEIVDISQKLIQSLMERNENVTAIGLTGQMHGILYVNEQGNAVSPLFTWEDRRGNLSFDGTQTWAEHLSKISGYNLAAGYGVVTHYYNSCNGLVPQGAVAFCTIADYLGMKLANLAAPKIDISMAASFGLFDKENGCFDQKAIVASGIEESYFPQIATSRMIGMSSAGVHIYTALGDNQASFLGATYGEQNAMLINLGTGGQISIHSKHKIESDLLEFRPYLNDTWLTVGAPLCGGQSYALLEKFFRETARLVTGVDCPAYSPMEEFLRSEYIPDHLPKFDTCFNGTRREADKTGSIIGITTKNFTPQHFLYGMLYGIANDMKAYYDEYIASGGISTDKIIGSGNGFRKNIRLCQIFSEVFQKEFLLSKSEEEAAFGAGLFAMESQGKLGREGVADFNKQ